MGGSYAEKQRKRSKLIKEAEKKQRRKKTDRRTTSTRARREGAEK